MQSYFDKNSLSRRSQIKALVPRKDDDDISDTSTLQHNYTCLSLSETSQHFLPFCVLINGAVPEFGWLASGVWISQHYFPTSFV